MSYSGLQRFVLASILTAFSSPSFAVVAIECGAGLNQDDATLASTKFLISSESDTLTGPSGENWRLYNAKGLDTRKAKLSRKANGDLLLSVETGQGLGGRVGIDYTIESIEDGRSFTKAKEVQVGGFAGGTATGVYDCVINQD